MWKRIKAITHAWGDHECTSLAAGVAYYGALSLFPLMMVLVAGVGYFLRFMPKGPSAKEEILAFIARRSSPEVSESLSKVLAEVQGQSLANGPVAAVAFLFAASLVFAQLDRGFYRIWDVRRKGRNKGFWGALKQTLTSRARSFAMIIGVCLLIVTLFLGGMVVRVLAEMGATQFPVIPSISRYTSLLIGSVINVVIFAFLYRYLSKEPVTWRLCFVGGLVAAVFWELGSRLLTMFSSVSNFSVYGLIGSFLLVLLWVYYNVMVIFIGALVVRVEVRTKKKGKRNRA